MAQSIFDKFYCHNILKFNGILSDLCTLPSGYNFKTSSYVDNGVYSLITIKNVNGLFVDNQKTNKLNQTPNNLKPYCLLKEGDVLISLTGNVGRISINTESNALLNQRVSVLLCHDNSYRFYIYMLLNNKYYQEQMEQKASGTSQKNLSPFDIQNLKIHIPDNIEKFNQYTAGIMKQLCKLNIYSTKLKLLKDTILPLLINEQLK